ncbi:MAG: hypothetical protein WD271_02315 [Acidimicrobiia bacterium]
MTESLTWMPAWQIRDLIGKQEISPVEVTDHFLGRNPTVTIGPLARDLRDAAITLQAMAGPAGRDFDCMQNDPPDCVTGLDAGIGGMRFAWTDDYGLTEMYAFEQSPRVIQAIRGVAMSLADLGAEIDSVDETWEDFWDGYVATNYLFGGGPTGTMEPPKREQWISAMDVRQRNWTKFRSVLRDHDVILSATAQIVAPTIEDWADYWVGKGPMPFPHGTFAPHYTSHTHMFNWLGFPAVSVPAGFLDANPRDEQPPVS